MQKWGRQCRTLYLFIRRAIKQTVVIIEAYHFVRHVQKVLSNILLLRSNPYAEEIIGNYHCGFRPNISTTDHIEE